jgi:hypothetical protein
LLDIYQASRFNGRFRIFSKKGSLQSAQVLPKTQVFAEERQRGAAGVIGERLSLADCNRQVASDPSFLAGVFVCDCGFMSENDDFRTVLN